MPSARCCGLRFLARHGHAEHVAAATRHTGKSCARATLQGWGWGRAWRRRPTHRYGPILFRTSSFRNRFNIYKIYALDVIWVSCTTSTLARACLLAIIHSQVPARVAAKLACRAVVVADVVHTRREPLVIVVFIAVLLMIVLLVIVPPTVVLRMIVVFMVVGRMFVLFMIVLLMVAGLMVVLLMIVRIKIVLPMIVLPIVVGLMFVLLIVAVPSFACTCRPYTGARRTAVGRRARSARAQAAAWVRAPIRTHTHAHAHATAHTTASSTAIFRCSVC